MRTDCRHLLGDVAAARGAQQHRGGDAQDIHERHEVLGQRREGVAVPRTVRFSVTSLVDCHAAKGAGVEKVGIITEGMRRAAAAGIEVTDKGSTT